MRRRSRSAVPISCRFKTPTQILRGSLQRTQLRARSDDGRGDHDRGPLRGGRLSHELQSIGVRVFGGVWQTALPFSGV